MHNHWRQYIIYIPFFKLKTARQDQIQRQEDLIPKNKCFSSSRSKGHKKNGVWVPKEFPLLNCYILQEIKTVPLLLSGKKKKIVFVCGFVQRCDFLVASVVEKSLIGKYWVYLWWVLPKVSSFWRLEAYSCSKISSLVL